ncbi:hypothetical protein [Microbacterium profundi]
MTGPYVPSPLTRLAFVAAAVASAVPLSGCMATGIPDAEPSVSAPETITPVPTDEPVEVVGDVPTTLSFEDGAALPSATRIEWGDGLMADDDWEIVAPDDGHGGWTYGRVDGTCTARFWQGYAADALAQGDDRASSDDLLAAILQTDAASVTAAAADGAFSYQVGGNTDVAHRQVTGDQDGRTWVIAARSFTNSGAGVHLIVDCAGPDASSVMTEVIDSNPIIAH